MSGTCGWYEMDPATGELVRWLDEGESPAPDKHYMAEDWPIMEAVWDFHRMVSERGRPPRQDIIAFLVDGLVPDSFHTLDQDVVEMTGLELAEIWENMGEEYSEIIGRNPHRVEKYWVAYPEFSKIAIGREQFYAGKSAQRELWLLHDLDVTLHDEQRWGRLRVFDDGSADAWMDDGLFGFDDERSASHFLGEAHYASLDILRKIPEYAPKIPPGPPTGRSDESQPFRYHGSW
jgi:hypothetical protein